ncbi:aldo/keto reductase [Microbacterium sp. zg.Y1090]|uniref:aldo/keto reductase n=1 Tax=Microbacterium TaxID=33882 RepID=UPI00214A9EB1|nr:MULTISPECIES: aldo/keto reductase [unclassified Microbacterium]MCR2812479.1 aldo/keto reductase [Microbacterium sp. zg.Y1084]MCR2817720.1 aldo/keto reductase [Microbacterium sp. zg.Y1090]MDL5485637.1 aldo/keto reductase [Microbacterium sp. zg-Y1211]WIM28808.1 aldo/keto reductase [Microbacterium sp. zg-Y1090]
MITIPTVTLNDGMDFPELGLGTYNLRGDDGVDAMLAAIDTGYRLLDSAVNYQNETEVGEAVRRSGIREELLITTKLPGRDHGYEQTLASAAGSLERLGLDRIDLYLIHWPNPSVDEYVESWRAMIELRERGAVRSIGVSNFTETMLMRLVDETGILPAVNQVEMHPYFPQTELRAFHEAREIRTESWSPLARRTELLSEPVITDIATAHGVTPTQVVLRWHTQLGSTPIPKSASPERQRENADVFGFTLTDDEVAAVSGLERGRLWDGDPDTHEEM